MTTLQVFLLSKPPTAIYSHSRRLPLLLFPSRLSLSFSSYPSLKTNSIPFLRYRKLSIITPCTFRSENANIQNSDSDSNPNSFLPDNSSQDANTLKVEDVGSGELYESSKIDGAGSELKRTKSEGEGVDPQGLMAERGSEIQCEQKVEKKSRFPVAVFLVGLWAMMKKGFEKFWLSEWMNWWPWHQETRLEKLIADADANPTDAAKQSSLLAELNKHSPESVIKRFDQRELAVDSRGVVEYLRALVATNAISEYLPDEQSGKPSSLPILLQELKQRASGNFDESLLSPGISEKQPLHVMMVDPKAPSRSPKLAQELFSTVLFTIAVGLVWVLGAAALQKYISSLGGIGTSGVGSSSSYSPKELSKEVLPEKNVKTFKDVKGCDDAKQELEEVVEYLKNPSKFTRLGGKLPKGILLTGAPGTGKTLLAKAIAGEAGVPFFYRAGSEFEEMFVGVGARRVRSLFQAAKKKVSS